MVHIIICEDNQAQRKRIEHMIQAHILMEEYDMEIALSTSDPTEVLAYSQNHPKRNKLYILDIDLNSELSGLSLAARIREVDLYSAIVFITAHTELMALTFQFRIEAMDYILKDHPAEIQSRIQACIDTVYKRYLSDTSYKAQNFQVKDGGMTRLIPVDDIMFFTSHPSSRKIVMHLENSQIHFYGSINELTEIGPDFHRSHKSFVVNLRNIKQVDRATKEIKMVNGETALVGAKKVQKLLEALAAL